MSSQRRVLGTASARWNDYVGTAAADEADASLGSPSLYSLVDLDRDRWSIVAVDVTMEQQRPGVTVYAMDRTDDGSPGDRDDDPGDRDVDPGVDPLAVSAFTLDQDHAAAFIAQGIPSISIRLTASPFSGRPLAVRHADFTLS